MVKAAITMFAYGVTILVIGYATMALRFPGAAALTAIIAPLIMAGLMFACAVASLMIGRNRRAGMIGIHVGLVLPLLFALAIGFGRLPKSLSATGEFNDLVRAQEAGVVVREGDKPRPTAYQSVGMVSMLAVSGFAFVALVMLRPKVPAAAPKAPVPIDDDRA